MSSAGLQGYFGPQSDPTKQALIQALVGMGGNQPSQGAYGGLANLGGGPGVLLNKAIQGQVQNQLNGQMFAQNRASQMGGYTPNMDPSLPQQQVQMPQGLFGGQ